MTWWKTPALRRGASRRATGLAFIAVTAMAGCDARSAERSAGLPPNVLIVLLDACRADKFSTFGFDRPTTPNLDALAGEADSVTFLRHRAQAAYTKPSTASLFTGHYPSDHRVELGSGFGAEFETMAEYFQKEGFETFAIATNHYLKPDFGFAQGFSDYVYGSATIAEKVGWGERFAYSWLGKKVLWWARRAAEEAPWLEAVVPPWSLPRDETKMRALARMIPEAPEPFFGYAHFQGCHYPYVLADREAKYLERFGFDYDEARRILEGIDFSNIDIANRVNDGEVELSEDDVAFLHLLYEAKTFYADELVTGGIVELLKGHGLYEDTLLIVTSDHGEALSDHGTLGHRSVFEEVLGIPLLVKFPEGGKPPALATRIDGLSRTIDLLPSLLAYFEIEPAGALPGIKLFDGSVAEVALAQSMLRAEAGDVMGWQSRSARSERFKLRESDDGVDLYDLVNDKRELRDVQDSFPEQAVTLRRALDGLRESEGQALGEKEAPSFEVSAETLRWLKAMGYVE